MDKGEDKITGWFAENSSLDANLFPIGIGDDMAMASLAGFDRKEILITTDMLLDGSHFDLESCGVEAAGYKAMAASLSDCAAMATRPLCAVVAVGLPREFKQDQLKKLHAGIIRAGDIFGCGLVGGDITSWDGKFAVTVTMISTVGNADPVRRNGAKQGDLVCVTGTLGGSLRGKHLNFMPRVKEALRLTEICKINSMMDITDGLSVDLNRICKASRVAATIKAEQIPVSKAASYCEDSLSAALNDGEDFELLFTLGPAEYDKLRTDWDMDLEISVVGKIEQGEGVWIEQSGQREKLEAKGFDHFK